MAGHLSPGQLLVRTEPDLVAVARGHVRADHAGLIVGFAAVILVVGVVLIGIGRYRPIAWVGIANYRRDCLHRAVWVLMHVVVVVSCFFERRDARADLVVDRQRGGQSCRFALAQLFGNALSEEILFRGFLFVQFAMMFMRWLPSRRATCAIAAGLLSSIIFAVPPAASHRYQRRLCRP